MALELTDANFQEEIANYNGIAVVDFWAIWCGPCKMIGPIIEEMAEKYEGKVKVGKLDVDHNDETAFKYSIRSIPTVLFFKNGEVVDRHVGTAPKSQFFEKVDALLQ